VKQTLKRVASSLAYPAGVSSHSVGCLKLRLQVLCWQWMSVKQQVATQHAQLLGMSVTHHARPHARTMRKHVRRRTGQLQRGAAVAADDAPGIVVASSSAWRVLPDGRQAVGSSRAVSGVTRAFALTASRMVDGGQCIPLGCRVVVHGNVCFSSAEQVRRGIIRVRLSSFPSIQLPRLPKQWTIAAVLMCDHAQMLASQPRPCSHRIRCPRRW